MERVLPFHAHKEESFTERLSRRVPLEIVPIRSERTHDLAIIASLHGETSDDISRYTRTIIDEFSESGVSVQVFFSDNTSDHRFSSELIEMKRKLTDSGIDFQFFNVPTPGKVHGLNKALKQVTSDYVMTVDPNKVPANGALRGLYEKITTDSVDLISALVARRHGGGNPFQWCNVGGLSIGKRRVYPGWPEVLNEDQYTLRLLNARGGVFKVAQDIYLFDIKGRNQTTPNRAKRRARWRIGTLQLDYLDVIDGNKVYHLKDEDLSMWDNLITPEGFRQLIHYIISLPFKDLCRFPIRALTQLLFIYKIDPLSEKEYNKNLARLLENPKLCAWTI